jgi:hypothetical protein
LKRENEYGNETSEKGMLEHISKNETGDLLKVREYYENGNLHREYEYEKMKSSKTYYYEDGALESQTIYIDGREVSRKKFYVNGSLKLEKNAGKFVFYYPNGVIKAAGERDKKNGPLTDCKFYYPDGQPIAGNRYSLFAELICSKVLSEGENLEENLHDDAQEDEYDYLLRTTWLIHILYNIETPPYLEGIDAIQWEGLTSFFSYENHFVPYYIKGLTSDDSDIRDFSIGCLEDPILHQGTIEEITAYVIPFLIKILEHKPEARGVIMKLLPSLVQDYFYSSYYSDEDDEDETSSEAFRGTLKVTAEGFSVFEQLINDEDEIIQRNAVVLVTNAYKERERAIQVLVEALQGKGNEIHKGNILYGLGMLLEKEDQELIVFNSYLRSESYLLQVCSALGLLRVKKGKVEPNILDILCNAVKNPEKISDKYEELVFVETSFESDVALVLSHLERETAYTIISHLIQTMKNLDLFSRLELTEAMLRIVFGEEGYTGQKLTLIQKEVLGSIIEREDMDCQFLNLTDILEEFGLPDDLQEIHKLIQSN